MTPPKNFRELLQLLGELADDQLSDAGGARLVELLRNDAAAQRYYLDYMQIHAQLAWKHELCDAAGVCSEGAAEAVESQGQRGASDDQPSTGIVARCSFRDGSLSAGPSLVGGFSLSYVIAAMIVGIGLAAASACEVSRFQAIANNSTRAAPAANVSEPGFSEPGFEGKTDSKPVWGDGQTSYASITELRGYHMDVKHQLKIAASEMEVVRTE